MYKIATCLAYLSCLSLSWTAPAPTNQVVVLEPDPSKITSVFDDRTFIHRGDPITTNPVDEKCSEIGVVPERKDDDDDVEVMAIRSFGRQITWLGNEAWVNLPAEDREILGITQYRVLRTKKTGQYTLQILANQKAYYVFYLSDSQYLNINATDPGEFEEVTCNAPSPTILFARGWPT